VDRSRRPSVRQILMIIAGRRDADEVACRLRDKGHRVDGWEVRDDHAAPPAAR
jgi:hypothetical protein